MESIQKNGGKLYGCRNHLPANSLPYGVKNVYTSGGWFCVPNRLQISILPRFAWEKEELIL